MFMILKLIGLLPQDNIFLDLLILGFGIIQVPIGTILAWLAFMGYKIFNGRFDKYAASVMLAMLLIALPAAALTGTLSFLNTFDKDYFGKTAAEALAAAFADKDSIMLFIVLLFCMGISAFRYLKKAARKTTGKDLEIVRI